MTSVSCRASLHISWQCGDVPNDGNPFPKSTRKLDLVKPVYQLWHQECRRVTTITFFQNGWIQNSKVIHHTGPLTVILLFSLACSERYWIMAFFFAFPPFLLLLGCPGFIVVASFSFVRFFDFVSMMIAFDIRNWNSNRPSSYSTWWIVWSVLGCFVVVLVFFSFSHPTRSLRRNLRKTLHHPSKKIVWNSVSCSLAFVFVSRRQKICHRFAKSIWNVLFVVVSLVVVEVSSSRRRHHPMNHLLFALSYHTVPTGRASKVGYVQ